MEVRLTFVEGANDKDTRGTDLADHTMSLYRWLLMDPELRGRAKASIAPAQPGQGHMGGPLEVVNVVVSNTIALGSLLVAVGAWRGSRPRAPEVRLERDGVVVTVQGSSPEVVEQILRTWDAGRPDDHQDSNQGNVE
ncbi:hypothetical protein ABZ840_22340 [Streptomyces sp. NPDC047117]|uniref:effector-associated constant component EACC1 n=1 Tax=Streptomyces sp. NPDC047117 TaxID=3155379 RepID=UPI0033EBC16B